MPLHSCEGVVLRAERIEESDRLVHFFTDRFGRVRAKAKGISRTTSRQGSVAEPFSHDHLSLYTPREDRAVFSLTGASLIQSHDELRNDLAKFYAASFVCELIDRCTEDGDPHYDLWLLLLETLNLLRTAVSPGGILMAFQLRAFRSLGVGLDLSRCAVCGQSPPLEPVALSVTLGGLLDPLCQGRDASARKLSPALFRALLAADTRPMSSAAGWDCPAALWRESVQAFRPYWACHLDFEPRSIQYLDRNEEN